MPFKCDHVADVNRSEFSRLVLLYQDVMPDFVKRADINAAFDPASRRDNLYADPVRRQFPCDTAVDTYLSSLYYQEKRAEFHPKDQKNIEGRLSHYVDFFKIKSAVDSLKKRWNELYKDAAAKLPDSAYAYVWVGDDGHKDRQLPITNPAEVKAAAEYVERYRDTFTFAQRHTMATKILEKAANFGASLGTSREFLEKQAGRGVCSPDAVVRMIQHRALTVKDPELKEQFNKIALTVKTAHPAALQPSVLVKLAETMDTLDRQLGNVSRYRDGLIRPEEVIFEQTLTKIAEDRVSRVTFTTGRSYEKQALTRLNINDVRSIFGADFTERVSGPGGDLDIEKFAEEATTLPHADAQMLESLLSDAGVVPAFQKAASVRVGIPAEAMALIASTYGE